MHILGTEPSSVILSQKSIFKSWKKDVPNMPKLQLDCPNGTQYPPRQPMQTPQVMRTKTFYLTARASTDGQGDSSIRP